MSSFVKMTKNPVTSIWEPAMWRDDYFGSHHYGVEFTDGVVYDPRQHKLETRDATEEEGQKLHEVIFGPESTDVECWACKNKQSHTYCSRQPEPSKSEEVSSLIDKTAREIIEKRSELIDSFFKAFLASQTEKMSELDIKEFMKTLTLVEQRSANGLEFSYSIKINTPQPKAKECEHTSLASQRKKYSNPEAICDICSKVFKLKPKEAEAKECHCGGKFIREGEKYCNKCGYCDGDCQLKKTEGWDVIFDNKWFQFEKVSKTLNEHRWYMKDYVQDLLFIEKSKSHQESVEAGTLKERRRCAFLVKQAFLDLPKYEKNFTTKKVSMLLIEILNRINLPSSDD